MATAELFRRSPVDLQDDFCDHHRAGVAVMTLQHSNDIPYEPAGTEQITLDEIRLQKRGPGNDATTLCLRAVGHQLKAEPGLVEQALELIVSHENDQVVVSAASLMAKVSTAREF